MNIQFADYVLLREFSQQFPQLIEMSGGNVKFNYDEDVINEFLGWDKLKAGVKGFKQGWQSQQPTPQPQAGRKLGNYDAWAQQMGMQPQQANAPAGATSTPKNYNTWANQMGLPQQANDPGRGNGPIDTTGKPGVNMQAVGNPNKPSTIAQAQHNYGSNSKVNTFNTPTLKPDYQALSSVYNAIKTPQLKQAMKKWIDTIFSKIKGVAQQTTMANAPAGTGSQTDALGAQNFKYKDATTLQQPVANPAFASFSTM